MLDCVINLSTSEGSSHSETPIEIGPGSLPLLAGLLRYLKQKAECDKTPSCEMGGFTRLLHSGQPDDLMSEVPTFVAQPLPESVVSHEYYPVLNRPYALLQWVQQTNITEEYVMMSEPDHIFLLPLVNFMKGDDRPAAFPFFYIEPHKVMRVRCWSGSVDHICP